MIRRHRFATPAVLLALGLITMSLGCGSANLALPQYVKTVRVQLPSYDEGSLQGIWMWRRSEQTGAFEPVSEIRLEGSVVENGVEYLTYSLLDPAGNSLELTLSAEVLREGPVPEVALWFVRFSEPGEFKASVYNDAGESGLSAETIVL